MLVVVTALALLAAVALTTWAVIAHAHQRDLDETRHRAIAVAEQFCLRVDGTNGEDMDGYRAAIAEVTTTKYMADFDKGFDQLKQITPETRRDEGKILVSGLVRMDDERATVIVAHDVTLTNGDVSQEQRSRWEIDLVMVDGEWRVDDQTAVS